MTAPHIQINLIKLASGERLLRLVDLPSGLALEKIRDPQQPVAKQKKQILGTFDAALAQSKLIAA